MEKLTAKGIEDYLVSNYGYCRHNPERLKFASQKTAKLYETSPINIFKFMVDEKPIEGLNVMSCGFQTALGREIVNTFENLYYNN